MSSAIIHFTANAARNMAQWQKVSVHIFSSSSIYRFSLSLYFLLPVWIILISQQCEKKKSISTMRLMMSQLFGCSLVVISPWIIVFVVISSGGSFNLSWHHFAKKRQKREKRLSFSPRRYHKYITSFFYSSLSEV